MKHFIVPAISALLFGGLPAQAQSAGQHFVQIAQSDSGRGQDKADRKGPNRGAKQGNSRAQGDGTKGAGQGAVRNRGDNSSGGSQNTMGAGRTQMGGPAAAGGGDQRRTPNHAGGAATTRGGATGGGAMTGGRSGGAATTRGTTGGGAMTGGRSGGGAVTGGGQTSGTVFGTRPSNWNRYPRQFDTNAYQRNYSAARHFHWRNYNRPNGWYYRRWGFGQIFPRIFWAQDYWLSDYWMFDLPIPPYGYVWVRYGDDAVLINRRTGRILQVVYGVFY